jgi:uncharacterized protein YjbI with pentapeptide repeats
MCTPQKTIIMLLILTLAQSFFAHPILAQKEQRKTQKKFDHEQYAVLKRCSDKKNMAEWNEWRGKNIEQKIFLTGAELIDFHLNGANLEDAFLGGANFKNASLEGANLKNAWLDGANFQNARLKEADLKNAKLYSANLEKAWLFQTELKDAEFSDANVQNLIFDIKRNSLPDVLSMANTNNLSQLKFSLSPHALVELRKAFKESGLRKQEREITYAIKHSGFENALENGNLLTKIEVILGWVFFELPCQWGMAPERPLFIMVGLMFLFSIPYGYAISVDIYGKEKKDGIWKVWIPGRMRDDMGGDQPKELLEDPTSKALIKGFYFSLLSAFHFGWRELNVGNWIARIQPHEYSLQASGWARAVSGIQSLISVYLLALSVLAYFGRPFESY